MNICYCFLIVVSLIQSILHNLTKSIFHSLLYSHLNKKTNYNALFKYSLAPHCIYGLLLSHSLIIGCLYCWQVNPAAVMSHGQIALLSDYRHWDLNVSGLQNKNRVGQGNWTTSFLNQNGLAETFSRSFTAMLFKVSMSLQKLSVLDNIWVQSITSFCLNRACTQGLF